MSQATTPTFSARSPLRAHWLAALSALVALLATAAVVLVLTIDGGSSGIAGSVSEHHQPVGGLPETAVAAAIGTQPATGGPDESAIAAAVSGR